MRTITILLLLLVYLSFPSSGQNIAKNEIPVIKIVKDKNIEFLENFYTNYISASCDLPEKIRILENLKKNSISEELIKKIDIAELDYDPFLDAQDCDNNWIKTLKVQSIQDKSNVYQVSYNHGTNKKKTILSLVNKNEKFVINNIDNNSDLSTVEVESKKEDGIFPNIKGKWATSCNESIILTIGKEFDFILPVMSNQIYIKAKIKKIDNLYHVFLIEPDDLGLGGSQLDWDNFSTEKPIANIEILRNETMSFQWLGFYHTTNKEIIFPDSEFNLETGSNPSILNKCQ